MARAAEERVSALARRVARSLLPLDRIASALLERPVRVGLQGRARDVLRGRLDSLRLELSGVAARGLVVDRLAFLYRDVHVLPGLPPRVRVGRVELHATVEQASLDRWPTMRALPFRVLLTERGIVTRAELAGFEISSIETDLAVEGSWLALRPRRVRTLGWPHTLVEFFRGYLPVPPLPRGARLAGVRFGPGAVTALLHLPGFEETLGPDLRRQLRLGLRIAARSLARSRGAASPG